MARLFVILTLALLLGSASTLAFSGYPTPYYPMNQYGNGYYTYRGAWGAYYVHGGPAYYPNYNGYYPYGYRTYGSTPTPWAIRTGYVSW